MMQEDKGGCFPLFNLLFPKEYEEDVVDKADLFVDQMRFHLSSLGKRERVIYLMKTLWGSAYGWGEERIGSVDCSGSLSYCLLLLGFDIRTTANGFQQATTAVPAGKLPQAGDLIFFQKGSIAWGHVAMFVDNGLSVLTTTQATLRIVPLTTLLEWYEGWEIYVGELNWRRLSQMSISGNHAWGVDPEVDSIRGIFKMEDWLDEIQ